MSDSREKKKKDKFLLPPLYRLLNLTRPITSKTEGLWKANMFRQVKTGQDRSLK